MEVKMNEYLTVKEVAKLLRLSQPTIYSLLKKKNGIPCHRIGGSWRFVLQEVQDWFNHR
jgi:excisionase family DNA binding protein